MKSKTACLVAICCSLIVGVARSRGEEFEAVSSRVSPSYIRVKQADGSYRPELYSFAKGGYLGSALNDKTIDGMDFIDIARVLAPSLATKAYLPAKEATDTKLLIVVYWGTTHAVEHASESGTYQSAQQAAQELGSAQSLVNSLKNLPNNDSSKISAVQSENQADNQFTSAMASVQASNRIRDGVDRETARMLGYDSLWEETNNAAPSTPKEVERLDMLDELEHYRYFVILMAYDFQELWKHKKAVLLWETRFSIREQNNAFDKQLSAMTVEASRFFGKDSGGLKHSALPEGEVKIGEVKSLGAVEHDEKSH